MTGRLSCTTVSMFGGYDRWYLLGSVGCAWAVVGIGWICAVAVLLLSFALWWIIVFPYGVMIGMSGEIWRHKSTLSPIPSSQDWAY